MRPDDPLDQLIAELDRVVPPDPNVPSEMQAAMTQLQLSVDTVLGYDRPMTPTPDERDPNDPEVREAVERGRRALNVLVGRDPDYVWPRRKAPRGRRPTRRTADDIANRS